MGNLVTAEARSGCKIGNTSNISTVKTPFYREGTKNTKKIFSKAFANFASHLHCIRSAVQVSR